MKTNIVIDISPQYLAKFWVSGDGSKCCQPINLQDSLNCNILQTKWMMKFVFWMKINIENVLQDDSITYGVRNQTCSKYPKQQVCNIFAIKMSKNTWRMKLILPADKHQRFLQSDTIILGFWILNFTILEFWLFSLLNCRKMVLLHLKGKLTRLEKMKLTLF